MDVTRCTLAVALAVAACRAPAPPPSAPSFSLLDESGTVHDFRAEIGRAPLTVVTFFSAHCPVQTAHDARLVALAEAYGPKGVAFLAIDAERSASAANDAAEAKRRGYPFPVFFSPGGEAARALEAEWATYSLVFDRSGTLSYAGGIDSDRIHLTPGATPYLKEALDDLLAGRVPRAPRTKVLGCALER